MTYYLNFHVFLIEFEDQSLSFIIIFYSNLGPLNAKMDFYEYLGVVRDATSGCIDNFRAAIQGDSL